MEQTSDRLNRLLDRMEIENLMGRYAHLHSLGRDWEIVETLFSSLESTTVEDSFFGVYELHGRVGGIRGYYREFYGMPEDKSEEQTREPGRLHALTLSSPYIEIRDDGQTAMGYWTGIGADSRVYPPGKASGIPSIDAQTPDDQGRHHGAFWIWNRYQVEFIREEGNWKIWHLHIYDIFRTPYNQDWVAYARDLRPLDDGAWDTQIRCEVPCIHATMPTRFHWQYSPDSLPPRQPDLRPDHQSQEK